MTRALIWGIVVAVSSLISFWLGRSAERSIWIPGEGFHIVSLSGSETYWTIRTDTTTDTTSMVGWDELTASQRQTVLYCDKPPNAIEHAREFLYEVTARGIMVGRVGPEDKGERYSLSLERSGGYNNPAGGPETEE
jgi:hypothetical protein